MKKVKITALLVVLAITFCFLIGGCSQNSSNGNQTTGTQAAKTEDSTAVKTQEDQNLNETGYPIVKEKVTLKLMGQTHQMLISDWSQNEFFKRMEELTNVNFEFSVYDAASYAEKKSLAFASGDLPDVFFKGFLNSQDEMMYGDQGLLIPLGELVDKYAVNLKNVFTESPMVKQTITTPSGEIYSLPCVFSKDSESGSSGYFWINKVWLDKLGLSVPTTIDELYNVLKAFKTQDPNGNGKADEIPMTLTGAWDMKWLMHAYGLNLLDYNSFVDDGKVKFGAAQPQYKDALIFLNKMYNEKLIDSETFTQTREQEWAKGKQEDELFGMFFDAAPWLVVGNDRNTDYVALEPLVSSDNSTKFFPASIGVERGTFAITNKCKVPDVAMRWIDTLYAPEYSRWAIVGQENKEWEWKDSNKTTWDYIIPAENRTEVLGKTTIQPGGGMPYLAPSYDGFWQSQSNETEAYVIKEQANVIKYGKIGYPMVYFDADTQKRINSLNADISAYVDQMLARFVTGDASIDTEWQNYVNKLADMGVDEYVKILQDRYDTFAKN